MARESKQAKEAVLLQQQCDKYWNDLASSHKYVRHGDIHIWTEDIVLMAKLCVRTFRIQRVGGCVVRRVYQQGIICVNMTFAFLEVCAFVWSFPLSSLLSWMFERGCVNPCVVLGVLYHS